MRRPIVCAVFAKPPRPGTSKTRLAHAIGAEAASELAGAFLRDTVASLSRLQPSGGAQLEIVLSTPEPDADHGVDLQRWDQGSGDLGERLQRTFQRALSRARAMIALGADSPGLPLSHIDALLTSLDDHDAVLAPSSDGGFWALGLTRCPDGLFDAIPWSAPSTGQAVRERLAQRGISVADGPPFWDIDTAADLDRFRAEISRDDAPQTWYILDTLEGR